MQRWVEHHFTDLSPSDKASVIEAVLLRQEGGLETVKDLDGGSGGGTSLCVVTRCSPAVLLQVYRMMTVMLPGVPRAATEV